MQDDTYGCPCCGGAFTGFPAVRRPGSGAGPLSPVPENTAGRLDRRAFLGGSAAVAGLANTLPAAAAAEQAAVTVFSGGTILTVDEAFSQAEAVAIRGNLIIAVGAAADVRAVAGPGAAEVDLAGRTMLPGFIDAHTHVVSGAAVDSIMENVGAARFATTAEVLDHLRVLVARTQPGEWVLARSFDPALQAGPDALTFAELDAVSADVPVFVINSSGHLA